MILTLAQQIHVTTLSVAFTRQQEYVAPMQIVTIAILAPQMFAIILVQLHLAPIPMNLSVQIVVPV